MKVTKGTNGTVLIVAAKETEGNTAEAIKAHPVHIQANELKELVIWDQRVVAGALGQGWACGRCGEGVRGEAEDELKVEAMAVKEKQWTVRRREREQKMAMWKWARVLAPKEVGGGGGGEGRRSRSGWQRWVRMEIGVDSGDLEMREERKWKG